MNILKTLLTFFAITQIFAGNQYTVDEVSQHDSTNNCWVIYDNGVYDLSSYISQHDKYLNIRSWCGNNITTDFQTKDGLGVDHKNSSYALLEQYYIGDLIGNETTSVDLIKQNNPQESSTNNNIVENSNKEIPSTKPYNLLLPLILTLALYWIPFFIIKNKRKFNAFWNTILLLTLLIPSLGFGIFMILRYQFPSFYNIDFKFMYWHVELSIVMGTIAVSHLLQRLKIYLVQLKQ